jgi:hypothetical protein
MKRKEPYLSIKNLKLQGNLNIVAHELKEGAAALERKGKKDLLTGDLNRKQMTCLL